MGDTFAATGARAGTARPKLGADASVAGSQARTPGGGGASGGGREAGAGAPRVAARARARPAPAPRRPARRRGLPAAAGRRRRGTRPGRAAARARAPAPGRRRVGLEGRSAFRRRRARARPRSRLARHGVSLAGCGPGRVETGRALALARRRGASAASAGVGVVASPSADAAARCVAARRSTAGLEALRVSRRPRDPRARQAARVLSNTSGRRHVARKLPTQGFDAAWLAGVVTSGELARARRTRWRGKRCVLLGFDRGFPACSVPRRHGRRARRRSTTRELLVAQGPVTIVTSAALARAARARASCATSINGLFLALRPVVRCARERATLVCNLHPRVVAKNSGETHRWTMPG